ncbi:MAG: lipid-A-disaccharide synthase [Rikenellaceae bacterium]|jgi:lipid-A-disaccharide synthase|nr:lipid-A-disaccharide synthase [Rikenellaceae bacterium]
MKVYVVAGEPSGDLLASGLMAALRRADHGVELRGVGGESMAAQGLESRFDIADISVMGVFEVLPRLRTILRHVRETADDILAWQPDVVVTVDSWGFVSQLLTRLRKAGTKIPLVHYVAPQVWAWKKGRAKNIARLVDRLMMLLPYEGKYFEKYGLQCDFVGHPVVERTSGLELDGEGFRTRHGIPPGARVVCVLPGSRRNEVSRLLPVFRRTLDILRDKYGDFCVVVPTVGAIEARVRKGFEGLPVRLVTGEDERYNAFAVSEIAIAKSGTVSLELAALRVPHMIAYTFNPFTNLLVKAVVKTPFANLINILAGREIVPEFVLERCRPSLIAACAEGLLDSPAAAAAQAAEAAAVLDTLRPPGMMPSERAAQIVIEAALTARS